MRFEKLIKTDSATIFLFLYGVIVQIVAFPVIYIFTSAIEEVKLSFIEALVTIWYCIPLVAVISVLLALVQIRERKINHKKCRTPAIGLILNITWLICYVLVLYMIFFIGTPLLTYETEGILC